MTGIEEKIKSFARSRGISVVGMAGPDRLDGPPSLDPTYTMTGARSIVSFALPMDVGAIDDFLSKKSPVPHNVDQLAMNQRIHRIGHQIAGFIVSLGFRARVVPANNTYRRSLDPFSTLPSFSHRFGAIAAGIAGQGWSGNVMTVKYGAAMYLDTVVTNAVLKSDPPIPPRYFMDTYCSSCMKCDKVCVAGMFEARREEHVLLNGELHPRGKRRGLDYCNASCFGLHAVSRDKKWSTWGRHWIEEWIGREPEMSGRRLRYTILKRGATTGDATPRYDTIRRLGSILWPEEVIDDYVKAQKKLEDWEERRRAFATFSRNIGRTTVPYDPNVLTCGHCALICGPTVDETTRRYKLLINSGFVITGPEGRTGKMARAATFEEAQRIRETYPVKISRWEKFTDALASTLLWHRYYFGIEPRSIVRGWLYGRRLKKAAKERVHQ